MLPPDSEVLPSDEPQDPPPIGTGSGLTGADGWTGGGFGTHGQGKVCWSVMGTPWSSTLTGRPLAGTLPPRTCPAPPALHSGPGALASTTNLPPPTVPPGKPS